MRPLTEAAPKALLRVAGRALLDRAIDAARAGGARRIVVNAHAFADQIAAHAAGLDGVVLSHETPEVLETGGGVLRALPLLGSDPFLALNADSIWTGAEPCPPLAAAWRDGMDALLLLARREQARNYTRPGDFFLDADGRPRRRGASPTAPFVYTGAQMLRPAALADAPEGPFSMNLIWDRAAARGRLFAVVHHGGWVDVGTPAGLADAEAALAEAGG
ncbi:MAG: nucleotidyltransferase family protein [Rhodobacteraceae bacterium]|nr:MAG: nucleotidyltransferase family protein [Paracoccaceae bacterium]